MSINNVDHHFPRGGNTLKLFTGLSSPKAGPTFPRVDAAAPIEDIKSTPIKLKTKEPTAKTIKYKIKKAIILKTIPLTTVF